MDLKKAIIQVLEEGHYHIPREIYKDMMDYYIEMYKKFRSSDSKRVTDKQFPPKTFRPDFSKIGKTFEFVKNYNPSVTIRFTANNEDQWMKYRSADNSLIQLSLNDPERVYTEIMEHELLHSLQMLLRHHEDKRRRDVDPKNIRPTKKNKNSPFPSARTLPMVQYAGVPKKKYIDQKYDWHGRLKDTRSGRRTEHSKRPIEYYPDLLSSIKSLQRQWIKFAASHAMDEKAIKSEEKKKNFFMGFYNNIKNNTPYPEYLKNFIPSLASKIFERFRNNGKNFVNMMLQKAYDGFVNKDFDFDPQELKAFQKEAEDQRFINQNEKISKQKQKIGSDKIFLFDSSYLKLNYYDRGEIFDDVENEESIDYLDGFRSDSADIVFDQLGLRSREDKRGNEYMIFPSKINNVVKLLKKVKASKSHTFDGISKEASDAIWDGVFKYFAHLYRRALAIDGIENLDKRWYRASTPEERKASKQNYDNQIAEYGKSFEDLAQSIYNKG